jgi:cell surface protein SprA
MFNLYQRYNIHYSLKNILKLGLKIFFVPFFILYIAISLGFSSQNTSQSNDLLLFDNCFELLSVIKNDHPGSKFSTNDLSSNKEKDLIKPEPEKKVIDLFDVIADTTKKPATDSLMSQFKIDSLKRIDSLSQDSTARIQNFKYEREDKAYTEFRKSRKLPLFAYPSMNYANRIVKLDSTGTKVTITDVILGKEARPYLEMPLEEYIDLRLEAINRDVWEQIGYKYELKKSTKDLSQLLTDITNIEIPLPSTSFLSIFGPPKISLKINGAVDIHGAWRNETTEGITTSALGNTRNEPDFKQQVQINLNGTIGDKLTINADWNTERTFQYENQLKIKYTGYEDEIVQSVEAGNVSLQTSSLVGGSEALFGVKAQFQMGPLSLTALASQKKGEIQEVSVSGGAKAQQFEIHVYDYSPNHFFLHKMYADRNLAIFNNFYSSPIPRVTDSVLVKDIEVWKTITGLVNPNERKGNAFINLEPRRRGDLLNAQRDSTLQSIPGIQEIGRRFMRLVQGVDYDYHAETGYISFRTQIQDQDAVAVAFRTEGPTTSPDDDRYYGEFLSDVSADTTALIVLKLVKPANLQPQFKDAWVLQLRNIYPIGGREVKEEGFKLDLLYRIEGQEPRSDYNGVKLLETFGLDRTDQSGTSATPDGAFDFFPNKTIKPSTGEVIFPFLEPFGRDLPNSLPDSLMYNAVYDTTVTFAKQDRSKDKFLISGEYSAAVSSVYTIGFNVVENSVKVLLNGMQLTEGVDYTVDYNIGQIIIRKAEALVPGADLKITYEQNDLFQLASKTLLGLRGNIQFSKKTSLGFSYLNLNQQTLSDKVRIGEEPLNNSIFGADFQTSIDLPFITKALDNVISTSAVSNFSLKGEFAYIDPDPNTKKSTITSDAGKSIAYIDDFEGAKRTIPMGMAYGSWKDVSVPNNLPVIGKFPEIQQMNYKANAYWYNITPSDVTVQNLYGDRKQTSRDQQQITALDFIYTPTQRGYYNWNPTLDQTNLNWAGMMKPLSSTANNLVEENIEFIEFWMYTIVAPENLKLHIDLGQISEDVIPNGRLDTEDKNSNDLVDEGEDTGIDGLRDFEEPGYNASTNPDPSNDNYSFVYSTTADYSRIVATEGNAKSTDLGRLPDSEDLNRNFTLDRVNSYFRYEVPLDTSKATNPFIQGGGYKGSNWYLFKVPLKDFVEKFGDPSFSVVETIRLWISGASTPVHIRFAELNLVGNQWQKVLSPPRVTAEDTVMTVSVINYEDNPEYYLPAGVQQEKDRTKPDEQVLKNEQSLNLIINQLEDGDKREVVKYLYKPLDVFNYQEMKLFIHGDLKDAPGSISHYSDPQDYASEVYLRFGSDTSNYYEYRQPVQADWNEVSLVFSELTAIKQRRDSTQIKGVYLVPLADLPGHTYGVRGNPTLTRISFFQIGIINPSNKGAKGERVSGDVWINELRVLGADDTPGWAYTASTSFQLADLLKVNFNINQTNPYFHKLAERFGTRDDRRSWGVSADLDVLKLIPLNLSGSNFKVSYSRNESTINPLYMPGTDIKVDEAQKQIEANLIEQNVDPAIIQEQLKSIKGETQTVSVSEIWSVQNFRIKIPTDFWLIRDTFNSLAFSFTYNKSMSRNPTIINEFKWSWNAGASYSVNLSRDNFFKPLDIPYLGDLLSFFTDYKDVKIFYAPTSISSNLTASRNRSFRVNRTSPDKPNVQRDFTTNRGAGLAWSLTEGGLLNVGFNYNFDIQSSLAYLLTENDMERSESEIWKEIFSGAVFGKDFNYRQNFDLRLNPKVPSIWDLNKYISITTNYSVAYTWQNNFQQEELGRSAGYSNRISAGLNIRLKSIFAPLFRVEEVKEAPKPPTQAPAQGGRRSGTREQTQQPLIEKPVQQTPQPPPTAAASPTRRRNPRASMFANNTNINPADTSGLSTPLIQQDSVARTRPIIPVDSVTQNLNLAQTDSVTRNRPLFQEDPSFDKSIVAHRDSSVIGDSIAFSDSTFADSLDAEIPSEPIYTVGLEYLKLGVKWLLLDYDQISLNFSQQSTLSSSGLKGTGTGFNNFFGIKQSESKGPNRLFMLGLSNKVGSRAPNGNLSDNYSHKNQFDIKTSRPLWEGAQLDLNWTVGWGLNKATTIQTDSLGVVSIKNLTSTGDITRSFVSLPSFLFISGGIKKVAELYDKTAPRPTENLSKAFVEGLETFSLFSKVPVLKDVMKYIPRPNWSLTWNGLEKIEWLDFAKKVSLQHAYTSTYNEGWKINTDGLHEVQSQKIEFGFNPLLGLSMQFDKVLGGNFTSSIRFSTKTIYNLGATTRNITESFTRDINISASYQKSGFELPLFGISLKNDLEVSASYTSGKSSSLVYKMDNFKEAGEPLDGTTRTTIEPKVKYVMSSRVTLSIFYRRTSVEPQGASRIPPTTTNEAGIDVHISIQ